MRLRAICGVFVSTVVVLSLYEAAKNTLLPNLGPWQSAALTTMFGGVAAATAAALVIRRLDAINRSLALRVRDHQQAETELQTAISRATSSTRDLERQLLHAQKMEAIGRLAGGIAHDFNNILTVIIGHCELLLCSGAQHAIREDLTAVHDAANRAAALTRQLLTFSRRTPPAPQSIDINDVVRGLEPMLRRVIGENIELVVRTTTGPLSALADRSEVEQIVMNLVVNARDAMAGGGTLSIETGAADGDAVRATVQTETDARWYAVIAVADTGAGIPPNVQERIFEPFFTTKEAGKGTGLGLSTVYAIARRHGGGVWFLTEPGRGTRFAVYLPAGYVDAKAAGDDRPATADEWRGNESILVVEDEDDLRRLIRKVLVAAGYRIVECRNGTEAIGVLEREAVDIALVLSDVVMPGTDGAMLQRTVRERWPGTPMLMMSGYTEHELLSVPERDQPFLPKPFTSRDLLAAVRAVLDVAASGRA